MNAATPNVSGTCPMGIPDCRCWSLESMVRPDLYVVPVRPEPVLVRPHIPRNREPTVMGLTLLGVVLMLAGAAFAAGLIVGGVLRLAGWFLALVRGP